MTIAYWNYFISLERDFIRTIDFVELDDRNGNSFSDNFAKLLLAIGSEVDVLAKAVCRSLNPASSAKTILDYQQELTAGFRGIDTIEIDVSQARKKLRPWAEWSVPCQSPPWWKAYNSVKHDRVANFHMASQINTLTALCGLFALNLYYYRNSGLMNPFPILLDHGFPAILAASGSRRPPGA